MLYIALKSLVALGLQAYHRKIEVHGVNNIPKSGPVLFLPNHQSALLDVLLVATDFTRKPYFLTRSDVFGKPILIAFFNYLKMIPVYRIRDGRDTLFKNDAIFDVCAQLLEKGEAVTMFPEANHNLKRRVRPLSKGFTRVIFKALERSPELRIQIVPVGFNYKRAIGFPDTVAVHYGEPISIQQLYDAEDLIGSVNKIKNSVSASLETLTTHIEPESHYDEIHSYLESKRIDFVDPKASNELINEWSATKRGTPQTLEPETTRGSLLYPLFVLLNFPVVLLWKLGVKPKVWEAEFTGTLRFATALVGFIGYYSLLFILFTILLSYWWALGLISSLFIFNWLVVKYARF